jgi:hypothetical protein
MFEALGSIPSTKNNKKYCNDKKVSPYTDFYTHTHRHTHTPLFLPYPQTQNYCHFGKMEGDIQGQKQQA